MHFEYAPRNQEHVFLTLLSSPFHYVSLRARMHAHVYVSPCSLLTAVPQAVPTTQIPREVYSLSALTTVSPAAAW